MTDMHVARHARRPTCTSPDICPTFQPSDLPSHFTASVTTVVTQKQTEPSVVSCVSCGSNTTNRLALSLSLAEAGRQKKTIFSALWNWDNSLLEIPRLTLNGSRASSWTGYWIRY